MLGAAAAFAIASSTWACVTASPSASVRMQPFCAPRVRSTRVSRRVSMFAMATVPSRSRYCAKVISLRKFDASSGRSLMTKPAAKTFLASTSSVLMP